MYQFASYVTTAMLTAIAASIGIMVFMTVAALFHRVGMGGKQDRKGKKTKVGRRDTNIYTKNTT